jgi:hypothetical protein
MEISLTDLQALICSEKETVTAATAAAPVAHLIGKRCIVRTRISGVSIGIITHIEVEASTTVRLSDAIRIWSWTDSAFTLSEMAISGAKCRVDTHPDGTVITETGMEILPVSDAAWAFIQANKSGKSY